MAKSPKASAGSSGKSSVFTKSNILCGACCLVGAGLIIVLVLWLTVWNKNDEQNNKQNNMQQYRMGQPAPIKQQKPYAATSNANVGAFPKNVDPSGASLMPDSVGEPSVPLYDQSVATQDDKDAGVAMDVEKLMPASWRASDVASCPSDMQTDDTEWTRTAPTSESFQNYINASGSARLSLNTRSPLARQIGMPDLAYLLRQPPKVPLAAYQADWNDSDLRQSLVYEATGQFPVSTAC